MKYHIEWLQSASDELTAIWIAAPSPLRKTITAASHALDKQLQINPDQQGESRPNDRRIAFFPPLSVTFRVDEKSAVVTVIHVWCFQQHNQ